MARRIDISLDGLHELLYRIENKALEDGDWAIYAAFVVNLIAEQTAKQERMAAKAKLAAATKKPSTEVVDGQLVASTSQTLGPGEPADESEPDGTQPPKKKGHGRNGSSAFENAKHFYHNLAVGLVGALCAVCGLGRMTRYREKVVIRVIGQPLFAAECHHIEQARCRICHRIIRAEVPKDILEGIGTSYTVYDWSVCAMLVVIHYFAAMPFKRLESLHQSWGIPLSDANLWRIADEADDLLLPLYRVQEKYGIQHAETLYIDDTGSAVIELSRKIQAELAAVKLVGGSPKEVRTGINATGVYLETPDGTVVLFFTGRHHAGEVFDRLLKHRKSINQPLVKVTDGASKNFDHQKHEGLIEAACNAHAYIKWHDIKDKHPKEYAVAGEVYKAVFDYDDQAKAQKLSSDERMLFHREHSKPLMEKLRAMCEEKLRNKLVEPNSALWEPLTFIINQWPRLTRFYEEPGVPLDSNIIERNLIIPVRYLAASFNYKTQTGAEVGDRMMSLIATAKANQVEPVAYLTHCLRNHEDLKRRPEAYLPWVYRERHRNSMAPLTPTGQSAG